MKLRKSKQKGTVMCNPLQRQSLSNLIPLRASVSKVLEDAVKANLISFPPTNEIQTIFVRLWVDRTTLGSLPGMRTVNSLINHSYQSTSKPDGLICNIQYVQITVTRNNQYLDWAIQLDLPCSSREYWRIQKTWDCGCNRLQNLEWSDHYRWQMSIQNWTQIVATWYQRGSNVLWHKRWWLLWLQFLLHSQNVYS